MICPNCQTIVECPSCEPERKMPEGCVCDPKSWGRMIEVCGGYESPILPQKGFEDYCSNCEHSPGCHKAPK